MARGEEFLTQRRCPAALGGGGQDGAPRTALPARRRRQRRPLPGRHQRPEALQSAATTPQPALPPQPPQLLSVIGAERKYWVLIGSSSRGAWRLAAAARVLPARLSGRFCEERPLAGRERERAEGRRGLSSARFVPGCLTR